MKSASLNSGYLIVFLDFIDFPNLDLFSPESDPLPRPAHRKMSSQEDDSYRVRQFLIPQKTEDTLLVQMAAVLLEIPISFDLVFTLTVGGSLPETLQP